MDGSKSSWTGSKKNLSSSVEAKRCAIDPTNLHISIRRQCELIGLNRSTYHLPVPGSESEENLQLMKLIDQIYTRRPFYGRAKMTRELRGRGRLVNEKRIGRLMRKMGLRSVLPGPWTSKPSPEHKIYPYLLRGFKIERPNQVWSTDLTYIPMRRGFMYLVAILDWYSRYVVSWRLSNTMEAHFCIAALEEALGTAVPEIFNSDQGSQFTSHAFVAKVEESGARMSMDGRGRVLDNILIERLWWSVKYEDVYIRDYETVASLQAGLERYFSFYNHERRHEALDYRTPAEVHFQGFPQALRKSR